VIRRWPAGLVAGLLLLVLLGAALVAPEHLPDKIADATWAGPAAAPPFGTDEGGRPLLDYATQGARVVMLPAVLAGLLVACFAVLGGVLRAMGVGWFDQVLQGAGEVVGALPRMVVILVVALVTPDEWRGLLPLAVAWALLSAPGAMDEAAAVAERLGGARFVEALRAHGYSAGRIYLHHIVALNLRPVVVRQAAEVMMQVVFLEIGLSYIAEDENQADFTHPANLKSWANLLKLGYASIVVDVPSGHALGLGLGLIGLVAVLTLALGRVARAR
jgi:ABC-type dipeptide/oligopeptide/nickel transport system permease subunit